MHYLKKKREEKSNMTKRSILLKVLLVYLCFIVLLPKNFSTIFGIFPVRLLLSCLFLLFSFYEIKIKKIPCNKINTRIFSYCYMLFLLFTIPSLFKSCALITSLYTIFKFFIFYLVFLVCIRVNWEEQDYKKILFTLFVLFGIKAVLGISEYFFDPAIFKPGSEKYPGSRGRIASQFFNPIYFGIAINLVFAYFFYAFYSMKKTRYKIGIGIILYFLFVCLLFTFTRSSFLIFGFTVVFVFICFKKMFLEKWSLLLILLCLASCFLIPGVQTFMLSSVNDSILLVTDTDLLGSFLPGGEESEVTIEDPSLEHRKEFAVLANRIAQKNILNGVGFGAYIDYLDTKEFDTLYSDYTLPKIHPHSAFVLLFAETGILSTIFYFLFFVSIFCVLVKNVLDNRDYLEKYIISSITLAVFIGFCLVNVIAENAIYDTQIYPLFLIIIALAMNFCFRKKKAKVLFISSTGGHLTEMLQLKPLFSKYEYHIVTEKTPSNLKLKTQYPGKVSFVIYGTKDYLFTYVFKLFINCFKELFIYIRFRPNVIVTTGAHTAGPMCCIGKIFGSKIIFIESFANMTSKTVTGSLVYPFADVFIVQWPSMKKYYPKAIVTEGVF